MITPSPSSDPEPKNLYPDCWIRNQGAPKVSVSDVRTTYTPTANFVWMKQLYDRDYNDNLLIVHLVFCSYSLCSQYPLWDLFRWGLRSSCQYHTDHCMMYNPNKKNISTVRANERPKILDNQRIAIGGSPVSGFGSCYSPNPSPCPRPHPSSK